MPVNEAPTKPAEKFFRGIIHRNAQHGPAWFFADDSVNPVVQVACDVEVVIPAYVVEIIKACIVDRTICRPVPGKKIGVKKSREKFNRYTFELIEEVGKAEYQDFISKQRELPLHDGNDED